MALKEDPYHPSPQLLSDRDTVYAQLLGDLLSGKLRPTEGDPLGEERLKTRYGLGSRMPVRMALAVLAGEGIVRQRPRHGAWLVQLDFEDIQQIANIRAGVEAMIANALQSRLAMTALSSPLGSPWIAMKRALQSMWGLFAESKNNDAPTAGVEIKFADLDTAFHVALAQAAEYDIAARHLRDWRNQTRLYRVQHEIHYSVDDLLDICEEHQRMFSALEEPSTVMQASDLARQHVNSALKRCEAIRAKVPVPA